MFSKTAYQLDRKERKHMNKAASQYLREGKKRIHCSHSRKTEFLCQLEDEVDFFCEEHDKADYVVLVQHFGSPEDIATEYLSELRECAHNQIDRIRRCSQYVTALIAIAVILLSAGVVIFTNYKQQTALNGYYVESITYESDVQSYITLPPCEVVCDSTEDNTK